MLTAAQLLIGLGRLHSPGANAFCLYNPLASSLSELVLHHWVSGLRRIGVPRTSNVIFHRISFTRSVFYHHDAHRLVEWNNPMALCLSVCYNTPLSSHHVKKSLTSQCIHLHHSSVYLHLPLQRVADAPVLRLPILVLVLVLNDIDLDMFLLGCPRDQRLQLHLLIAL